MGKHLTMSVSAPLSLLLVWLINESVASSERVPYPNRPNIIVIMADDMGFHDVSYHSKQLETFNIDALGYQGIILNRHYTPSLCTPSRASFLTGRYSIFTGMQHDVIKPCQPYGLPLEFKLLPQYLKQGGYMTHLVGKWHLGYFEKEYTPTERGFDTFFGFYNGLEDYYKHNTPIFDIFNTQAYDYWRNGNVTYEGYLKYNTHLFTNKSIKIIREHNPNKPLFLLTNYNAPHYPLEAPQEDIDRYTYIKNDTMRIHAAMISVLDQGIGKIIKELSMKNMLKNTLILFYSDNGGPTKGQFETEASNYPLKGQKNTIWEGATRVPAVIWHNLLKSRHTVSDQLIHNTDWLPTFLKMARVEPEQKLDGFDIWPALSKQIETKRTEMIHDIDPIDNFSSYYNNGWKYVNGSTWLGRYDKLLSTKDPYPNPNASRYPEDVQESDTWKALAPYALWPLTSFDIEQHRKATKVSCHEKDISLPECKPLVAPCLFRVYPNDPCEQNNLAHRYPEHLRYMEELVEKYKREAAPAQNPPNDFKGCNPRKFNGSVSPWVDSSPTPRFSLFNVVKNILPF